MDTVTYEMTASELVHAAFARKLRDRRFVVNVTIVVLALAVLLAYGVLPVPFAFLCLAYPPLAAFVMYRAITRLVARSPWLTAPTTLRFDERGLRMSAGDYGNEVAWSGFGAWRESPEHYVLYLGRSQAAITLPKRAFDTAQAQRLRRHVETIAR